MLYVSNQIKLTAGPCFPEWGEIQVQPSCLPERPQDNGAVELMKVGSRSLEAHQLFCEEPYVPLCGLVMAPQL
jgi:hypothetical protein